MWHFPFQQDDNTLRAFVDTDFAGCLRTRRSTSGGCTRRGLHVLQHWSTTQSTVALSSGEAELSGICRGSSKGIGLQSLCGDLGLHFDLAVLTDATAAIGICRRCGLGKVRHLAVADLWVQEKVRAGDCVLERVPGSSNPADMLTKHIDAPLLSKHLSDLGMTYEQGRPDSAPSLTH